MLAVASLSISLGTRAHAADLDGPSASAASPGSSLPAPVAENQRSPSIAGGLAVLSPVISIAAGSYLWTTTAGNSNARVTAAGLIVLGLWVGPSAGHIYAGEWGHAIGMSTFRLMTSTAGGIVLFLATLHGDCEDGPPGACDTSTGAVLLGTGLLLAAGASAVYDIIDAPRAAERANRRFASDLALAPIVAGGDRGGTTRGLALVGRF